MKILSTQLKPGSIILYKEYGFFTKLWYKLRRKELSFNRFGIISEQMELLSTGMDDNKSYDFISMQPVKAYSREETKQLNRIMAVSPIEDFESAYVTMNAIRPNTFVEFNDTPEALLKSKYYKKIDLRNEAEYDKYIF